MKWIYWLGWLFFRSMARAMFGFRVRGRENLVTEGPVLVASNHESFLDPPLVGIIQDVEMHFLARRTLFVGLRGWLYRSCNAVPVDQERPDMTSLKTIIKLLQEGEKVVVYPEGQRSWDGTLGEAQPGIGLIVAKTGAVVQPIRIRGAREALPRGSGRLRCSRVSVTVGKPLRFTAAELAAAKGKQAYQKIADRIMAEIAAL